MFPASELSGEHKKQLTVLVLDLKYYDAYLICSVIRICENLLIGS